MLHYLQKLKAKIKNHFYNQILMQLHNGWTISQVASSEVLPQHKHK